MNQLHLFLPCAAGVESYLAEEVRRITGVGDDDIRAFRAGVMVRTSWRDVLQLNLHSRLAQRVLVELSHTQYRQEEDHHGAASVDQFGQRKQPNRCRKATKCIAKQSYKGGHRGVSSILCHNLLPIRLMNSFLRLSPC